jgi:hypothetical protein
MVESTGSAPKRNMVKTFLLGALALVGIVCLFQSGAVNTHLVGHHGLAGEVHEAPDRAQQRGPILMTAGHRV